jgi:hypothetical protein
MYNQRESLACIVITPALQAGGRGIVTLSAHHQTTENTSARFHLIACRARAGGHFVRQNSGKLPKNCQGGRERDSNPRAPRNLSNLLIRHGAQAAYSAVLPQGTHVGHTAGGAR